MNCGRVDCTGIHTKSHGHSHSELCPAAKERCNAACREQAKKIGTATYNRNHGIGEAARHDKEGRKRRSQTPGTYIHSRNHRMGAVGEAQRIQARRIRNSPGTYDYKAMHGEGLPGLRRFMSQRTWKLTRQREELIAKHPDAYAEYLVESKKAAVSTADHPIQPEI